MSYRLQVQALVQLHVDPAFRSDFRRDAERATPGLSAAERAELLRLPVARSRPSPAVGDAARPGAEPVQPADSAFMRIGVQRQCGNAMPRTYAAIARLVEARGQSVEADFLRNVDLWQPVPPEYERDGVRPNPTLPWTETALVLQMANRVYWLFHNYALGVARREPERALHLESLSRFEFDTLARRIVLYRTFAPPGPTALQPDDACRLRLSPYAEMVSYPCTIGARETSAGASSVVFLYDGRRLRVLRLDAESGALVAGLDGSVPLGTFTGRTRSVLEGLANVGALAAAA